VTESDVEELTVEGIAVLDGRIERGEVVHSNNDELKIEVRIINNNNARFFTTGIRLKHLVQDWERGEAPVEMPGMLV